MKILWITNILFPDICDNLGISSPVTGGWMVSLADNLIKNFPNIDLHIAALYGEKKALLEKKIGKITYHCLPYNPYSTKYNNKIENTWKYLKQTINPDIVHIHGTEYPYGLAYIKANGNDNVVVSIQGLVRVCAQYSLGYIEKSTLKKHLTIYDLLRKSIINLPNQMLKQGKYEIEYIQSIRHIIGRTDWDKDHIWVINPYCKYHFCNEILRTPFYSEKYRWNINKCEKYSIFLSQAYTPLKGLHQVIKALPIVLNFFPQTKIYISGVNFLDTTSLKNKLRFNSYAKYIKYLMNKYNISHKVIFTGLLDENQMAERYAKSHIFICPSSIENSPNSLGEAQLLGVPCIASYVGGIPNMVSNNKTGLLYRFEEYEMLASLIYKIFSNDELALTLSANEKEEAIIRHDPIYNSKKNYEIYKNIISDNFK